MQHHLSQSPPTRHLPLVVFRDQSAGLRFLTRSARTSEHSTTWEDGNIYPVIEVDLSSAAHLASPGHARHVQRTERVAASA